MKTKKFKFKQLFKLQLLKSRVYEHPIKKTNLNDLANANLDQILVGIKKALQIIFQYNQTSKCILFIGLPSKLESRINVATRHVAVPKSFNIQGLISNNSVKLLKDIKSSTQLSFKASSQYLLPKLAKTPDLIMLFDHEKGKTLLSEAWVAKIPLIAFEINDDFRAVSTSNSYVINGNFKNALTTLDKNVFFISLNFLFKKFEKSKKKPLLVLPKKNSASFTKATKSPKRKAI